MTSLMLHAKLWLVFVCTNVKIYGANLCVHVFIIGLPTLLSQQFLSRKSSLAKPLLTIPLSNNFSLQQFLSRKISLDNSSLAIPLSQYLSCKTSLAIPISNNSSLDCIFYIYDASKDNTDVTIVFNYGNLGGKLQ